MLSKALRCQESVALQQPAEDVAEKATSNVEAKEGNGSKTQRTCATQRYIEHLNAKL